MREVTQVPAEAVRRLIGDVQGLTGVRLLPSDCFYWGDSYYRVDTLAFDAVTNRVTLPDGMEVDGGFVFPIYRACEREGGR
jgi:hypothetical protein